MATETLDSRWWRRGERAGGMNKERVQSGVREGTEVMVRCGQNEGGAQNTSSNTKTYKISPRGKAAQRNFVTVQM